MLALDTPAFQELYECVSGEAFRERRDVYAKKSDACLCAGVPSKGAYSLASDLPNDTIERDDILLRIMGSPEARQIQGLGGGHPFTSKIAIVSASRREDVDIDFFFRQVNIEKAIVYTTSNCGNIFGCVREINALLEHVARHERLALPT